MNTPEKPKGFDQRWILAILFILFALPAALSWFLFNYTDFARGGKGAASHGELIIPPRLLPDVELQDPAGLSREPARLYGKWSLVYLLDGRCGRDCEQNLYRMRQIRLAMGKNAHRVQRLLMNYGNVPVSLNERQLREYPGQLMLKAAYANGFNGPALFELSEGDNPLSAHRIYIVDPRGFLMMSYAPDADPAGIIEDLKQLLRYSSIG